MSDLPQNDPVSALTEGMWARDPSELPRAYQMARLYALGKTLQEIADVFELTREGVRQVINRHTPWTTTTIGAARKRAVSAAQTSERDAVGAWSTANPGSPISQAAEELGISENAVRGHLGRRVSRHERIDRAWPERRPEDELIEGLCRFNDETGQTTSAAYARWARVNGVPGPQTIAKRFGSWNEAATKAGFKMARPIERERRHADEDLWAIVVEGVRAGYFTAREFEDWLSAIPGAPSFALIRQRLTHGWAEIREEATKVIQGRSQKEASWVAEVSRLRDWSSFLSHEDPLEHMRAARLALGPNITMVRYAEWAEVNKRPVAVTILRRSGRRWAELVEAVGGTPVHKQLRFEDDELLAWMRAFLDSDRGVGQHAYDEWRAPFGAPGSGTIATRFGGWDRARSLAKR